MNVQVTFSIPQLVYQQAVQLAERQHMQLEEMFSQTLTDAYIPYPLDENHDVMEREVAAYKTQHPMLCKQYLGQYVAVYQGEVVDHALDFETIYKRTSKAYPNEVVLLRRVEKIPERIMRAPSPRWIRS